MTIEEALSDYLNLTACPSDPFQAAWDRYTFEGDEDLVRVAHRTFEEPEVTSCEESDILHIDARSDADVVSVLRAMSPDWA
jgi:hypothetical protein